MQVNVQFLQQLQPEWSRFVTIVKQAEKIDIVSYHKLFDILKQFQLEVNDIRAERIAKSANPLALLAAAQPYSDNYYQAPKPQTSNAPSNKQSSSTRTSASTRHKAKKIANTFKNLYKPTNNNLRTSSNSKNKTEDTTPRYNNDNQSRQFGNQRTITVAGARETVGSPVVQQNGIQCFNCKGFGHIFQGMQKPKREGITSGTSSPDIAMCNMYKTMMDNDVKDDSDVIPDSSNICTNDNQVDQNAAECVDERAALANLTLDMEENKTVLKQLKKANASLTQELKECKTNLDESSRALGEATSRSQFEGQLKEKTKVISDLKVKEGKDIDTMIEMEKQIKFLNEILYKRNQSIQTIHMLAPKCATYHGRSTFANPKYCKQAQSNKPCLYQIPYDTSDPANRFAPDGEEIMTLTEESRSKLDKDTVKPYNYTYQNSLYETFKPPSKAHRSL
ncbi:hypothetical protein Tco_0071152 [Tanacetum coccineum]